MAKSSIFPICFLPLRKRAVDSINSPTKRPLFSTGCKHIFSSTGDLLQLYNQREKKDMKQLTLKISLFFNNLLFMYAIRCLIIVTHLKYNAYPTWWTSILVSSTQRLTWNAIASFRLAYTINCLRNTSAVALTVNWSDISAAHITCVMN